MSDYTPDDSASAGDDDRRLPDGLPEHLPPVEPPSAGFIVQLFLIPALIVMAVVGVWALFGRMAAGEQDWQVLVTELQSNNEHRHWRAALGLAQLLEADRQRGDEGQNLTANHKLAEALASQLDEKLAITTPSDEEIKQAAYLARTLGLFDVPQTVIPTLRRSIAPQHDREVRKNALGSIAVIAGRAAEHGGVNTDAVSDPDLTDDVIAATEPAADDDEQVVQQLAAYTLGLLPTDAAQDRLEVLLAENFDRSTRVNAAVGLARRDSTAGLPVFREVLTDAVARPVPQAAVQSRGSDTSRSYWMGGLIAIAAVGLLALAAAPKKASKIAAVTFCVAGLVFVGWRVTDRARQEAAPPAGAAERPRPPSEDELREAEDRVFADYVAVRNTLKAVADLSDNWTGPQREELTTLIEPIADNHREADIRNEAARALQALAG